MADIMKAKRGRPTKAAEEQRQLERSKFQAGVRASRHATETAIQTIERRLDEAADMTAADFDHRGVLVRATNWLEAARMILQQAEEELAAARRG